MSPFKVNKAIKEYTQEGKRITVDILSEKCGTHIRHKYLRMSKDVFACEENDGFLRHWVLGLSWRGWLFLWTSKPKSRFETVAVGEPTELEDAQDTK